MPVSKAFGLGLFGNLSCSSIPLPQEISEVIKVIPRPLTPTIIDLTRWKANPNGVFSMKSNIELLAKGAVTDREEHNPN